MGEMFPWINTKFLRVPLCVCGDKFGPELENPKHRRGRSTYRAQLSRERDGRGKKEYAVCDYRFKRVSPHSPFLWCNSTSLLRAELDEVGDRYKKMPLAHVEAVAQVSVANERGEGKREDGRKSRRERYTRGAAADHARGLSSPRRAMISRACMYITTGAHARVWSVLNQIFNRAQIFFVYVIDSFFISRLLTPGIN